jgi:phosphate transport system substrate-binding protein
VKSVQLTCVLSLLLLASLCVSCSSNVPSAGKGSATGGDAGEVKLQGTGASFPAPLYNKWFKAYSETHPAVIVDYQSVGSGAGVKAVTDKTVDFGASDAAMTPEEMAKVEGGVQLLPMTAGTVVLAYNLEGVDDLKLSREAYTGIFLGKITKWDDPAIASTNPGVKLPGSAINVVVRADSSGTTYVFTKHLSAISEEFAASPGTNKMPNWPVGTASKGNEGVSTSITTTPDSIGYIEYVYAKGAKLKNAKLQNKAGKFVDSTVAAAQAALASAALSEELIAWVPDPEGDASYPIVTYTWIIAYKNYADPQKAKALKDVLAYCLDDAQQSIGASLGYVPLPATAIEASKQALNNIGGGEASATASTSEAPASDTEKK